MISGLRMAFVSSGNEQGSWLFRIVHGRPPQFDTAMEQLLAAKVWVLLWGLIVTCGACFAFRVFGPAELLTLPATASQLLVAAGMCLVLTDIMFLNVKFVAFTGERASEQPNLAISVLKYFALVPAVASVPLISESWIEISALHFILAAAAIVVTHLALRRRHRAIVGEHCNTPGLEEDEEEFPLKLGTPLLRQSWQGIRLDAVIEPISNPRPLPIDLCPFAHFAWLNGSDGLPISAVGWSWGGR